MSKMRIIPVTLPEGVHRILEITAKAEGMGISEWTSNLVCKTLMKKGEPPEKCGDKVEN